MSLLNIQLVELMAPGVAKVLVNGQRELWTAGTARVARKCELCGRLIEKRQISWHTTSNGLHRSVRVGKCCWRYR